MGRGGKPKTKGSVRRTEPALSEVIVKTSTGSTLPEQGCALLLSFQECTNPKHRVQDTALNRRKIKTHERALAALAGAEASEFLIEEGVSERSEVCRGN